MSIKDVEDALDKRDVVGIEAAFRDLIEWPAPATLDDAEDPGELASLLDRVTAALEADHRLMPQRLVDGIVAANHDGTWFHDDRSYAAGARAVAAKNLYWTTIFRTRLGLAEAPTQGLGAW